MNQPPEISRPLRIFVVEPNFRVREALTDRLKASPILEIVASSDQLPSDPAEVWQTNAQVLLCGLSHGLLANTRRLARSIRRLTQRDVMVLGLTPFDDAFQRDELISAGVSRIILKQIETPKLIDEIMEAMFGN